MVRSEKRYTGPDGEDWSAAQWSRHEARSSLTACGAMQLILGVGGLAVGGASLAIRPSNYEIATGLWAGGLVFIAGIVSLATRKSSSKKSLEASMAFSIIAFIVSAPWVWFTATGAGFDYYKFMQTGILNSDILILNIISAMCAVLSICVSVAGAVASKHVRDEILEKLGY